MPKIKKLSGLCFETKPAPEDSLGPERCFANLTGTESVAGVAKVGEHVQHVAKVDFTRVVKI
jgi:hypothetical protein